LTDYDKMEIILVEDNPHDAELTLRALKKRGLANNVQVLQDGAEALDFVFCKDKYSNREMCKLPKLILLDLKLPKVDGLEVLRRIKNDPRTKAIPIVILTSSQEEPDIVESYQLGVNSYIVKPVDFDKFFDAVSHLGLYWMLLNKMPA